MVVRQPTNTLRSLQALSLPLLLASLAIMSLPTALAQTPVASPTFTATTLSIVPISSNSSSSPTSTAATSPTYTRPASTDNAPSTFNQGDPDSSSSQTDTDNPRGMINYYFVFLALFIVLAFLGIFFLNRRRMARKEAWRTGGQDALRRDVGDSRDGGGVWVVGYGSNARRWHRREESRRVEGLNELGQAPPPYVPPSKSDDMGRNEEGVQVPLRTLARDEGERDRHMGSKPPEYSEREVRADSTVGERTPRSTAAEGSTSQPNAS